MKSIVKHKKMHRLTITLLFLCLAVFSGWTQEGKLKNRTGVIIGKQESYFPGIAFEEFKSPQRNSESFVENNNTGQKSATSVLLEEYFDEWPPVDWSIYLLGNAGTWMHDAGQVTALHTWEDGINKKLVGNTTIIYRK